MGERERDSPKLEKKKLNCRAEEEVPGRTFYLKKGRYSEKKVWGEEPESKRADFKKPGGRKEKPETGLLRRREDDQTTKGSLEGGNA